MPAKTLHFQSPRHLSQLYAGKAENLAHAERALGVKLVTREDWLKIEAAQEPLALAEEFFAFLNAARSQGMNIRTPDFARLVDSFAKGEGGRWQAFLDEPLVIATNRKSVVPKTIGQKEYLQSVLKKPIVFGIGPGRHRARPTWRWRPPCRRSSTTRWSGSCSPGPRSRRARPWASCRATSARRSSPTCGPSTMRSTTCSTRRRW